MVAVTALAKKLEQQLGERISKVIVERDEITVELDKQYLRAVALLLRDEEQFAFTQLIDVCGVDYSEYGLCEWVTDSATCTGFERAAQREQKLRAFEFAKPTLAVAYHLLSVTNNQRLRLRVFLEEQPPMLETVVDIWPAANWFEREAFDLFGIIFDGHPDLRRILTDYGFVGHPFRKDFPLSGHVEMRFDAGEGRVIYQPVSIQPRTLVPRVIRKDSRYQPSNTDSEQE